MQHLLQKLNEVEAEMKAIGYWSDASLSDTGQKTFEHWLQFQFLPTARRRIETRDLPRDSSVGLMAMRQYDYHSFVPEAQRLLSLLREFDRQVSVHQTQASKRSDTP
jgi:uncharacterized protein YqcC (DUF446 family)